MRGTVGHAWHDYCRCLASSRRIGVTTTVSQAPGPEEALMNTAFPTLHEALPAALLACALLALALGGCNTVAGLGEDVEAAGSAVEQEAEEEKRY